MRALFSSHPRARENDRKKRKSTHGMKMQYYSSGQRSTTSPAYEVLLLPPTKYYSSRQRSTTPPANEVLLLPPMKYYFSGQ